MILTAKQEEGLKIAVERYRNNEPYTVIGGYAGTGKSTLIKFIIAALDIHPDDVCYIAYTGKAATVLQQKGCPNATTAHQLLYYAKPMPNGTFKFFPKSKIDYKIVVIDEISMLPRPMWEELLKHRVYIIAAGDPGQLPPVDKDMDNGILNNPHIFLDEIMRQAQDSEIIRLSMWVREGKPLGQFPCKNEQVQLISPCQVVDGMYSWADQILCATNKKRKFINNFIRQQKGYGSEPCVGDKVISLHNHWNYLSANGTWTLTNGSIGNLIYFYKEDFYIPKYIKPDPITFMFANIELEDKDTFNMIPIDYKALLTGEPALDGKQSYLLKKSNYSSINPPFDFTYAYAITCHKAQGSEWDKVLVHEEGFPFSEEEHRRWLYTAVTRAKNKLVLVKN